MTTLVGYTPQVENDNCGEVVVPTFTYISQLRQLACPCSLQVHLPASLPHSCLCSASQHAAGTQGRKCEAGSGWSRVCGRHVTEGGEDRVGWKQKQCNRGDIYPEHPPKDNRHSFTIFSQSLYKDFVKAIIDQIVSFLCFRVLSC